MTSTMLLATEILLALAVSLAALGFLRDALPRLLEDVCGTALRGRFWNRFTQLALLFGPLFAALVLSDGSQGALGVIDALRDTLKHALSGMLVTLAGLGFVIWRTVPVAKRAQDN